MRGTPDWSNAIDVLRETCRARGNTTFSCRRAEHRNPEEIHGTYENVPGPGISPKCYTLGLMKQGKYKKSSFPPRTGKK